MRRRVDMAEKARENANVGTGSAGTVKARFLSRFLTFSHHIQFNLIGWITFAIRKRSRVALPC